MKREVAHPRALVLDPFGIIAFIAVVYVGLLWLPHFLSLDSSDFFSGALIVGFVPEWKPLLLFVGGIVLLGVSYWAVAISTRLVRLRRLSTRVIQVVLGLYVLSVVANVLAFVFADAIPLLDIAARQSLSPKLVWLGSLQITLVPTVMLVLRSRMIGRTYWAIVGAVFLTSLLMLSLLGTRSLPLKLIIATAVAVGFIARVRPVHVFSLGLGLALTFVSLGALSKSQIYEGNGGFKPAVERSVNQAYLDSVGMFFRLWIIVEESDASGPLGLYHGRLLGDTVLNIVPGIQRLYANYQIGELVAAREVEYLAVWQATVADEQDPGETGKTGSGSAGAVRGSSAGSSATRSPAIKIDLGGLPISQAPTVVGAAYADFGLLGLVLQMVFVGGLMGALLRYGSNEPILLGLLAGVTGHVAAGINLGLHGEQTLILLGISTLSVVAVALRNPGLLTRRPPEC